MYYVRRIGPLRENKHIFWVGIVEFSIDSRALN